MEWSRQTKAGKWSLTGLSRRKLAFKAFKAGKRWQEVAEVFGINKETCRHYHQVWKRLPPDFENEVRYTEKSIRQPETRAQFVMATSRALKIRPEDVQQILLRPWGVRSILLVSLGLKKLKPDLSASINKALGVIFLFFSVAVYQSVIA